MEADVNDQPPHVKIYQRETPPPESMVQYRGFTVHIIAAKLGGISCQRDGIEPQNDHAYSWEQGAYDKLQDPETQVILGTQFIFRQNDFRPLKPQLFIALDMEV